MSELTVFVASFVSALVIHEMSHYLSFAESGGKPEFAIVRNLYPAVRCRKAVSDKAHIIGELAPIIPTWLILTSGFLFANVSTIPSVYWGLLMSAIFSSYDLCYVHALLMKTKRKFFLSIGVMWTFLFIPLIGGLV